jgi:glycolate oxidase iron-sulfur subunit
MQTRLQTELLTPRSLHEADRILRSCVHCGFCNATCPTYQLFGDELDGPRGRIYLMKQALETGDAGKHTRLHLDRCLTCRACETTCPSGVEYGRLLDIARPLIATRAPHTPLAALTRRLLGAVLSRERWFTPLLRLGQWLRPFLPASLRLRIPAAQPRPPRLAPAAPAGARAMVALRGCVQPAAAPRTNAAAARVLSRFGIHLIEPADQGCCGALGLHLGYRGAALSFMRTNVDAWSRELAAGAEAVVMTASGCGVTVREYGALLAQEPEYAQRATRVAAATRDLAEIVAAEDLKGIEGRAGGRRIAFQSPCTLQHGQRVRGLVETILARAGYALTPVADGHLCCGSAGAYSILEPAISAALLERRVTALQAGAPELIATANIGCQLHLARAARVPVVHWIELLDELLDR